jgi:branched-chain amino acid transport system substrate-binding protein
MSEGMRKLCTHAVVAVAMAVAMVACNGGHNTKSTPTAAPVAPATIVIRRGQPIKIAVSAALSGDQSNLGTDIAGAAELALATGAGTIRGHAVTIVRRDDGCTDAEKAIGVARTLVGEDGVAGVIGPMCTTGAQAANSVYEQAAIVHIAASATRVELSRQNEQYFFRTAWNDGAQAASQAGYAASSLQAATVTVIDDGEPYGQGLGDDFVEAFESLSGRVLSRERIARGSTDFSALSKQIKSANPDAVVYEGLDPEGLLIVKALREAGYSGFFIGGDALLSVRDFAGLGGTAVEGAIVSGGAVPDDAFNEKFRTKFDHLPATPFVLQSYDAVTALMTALASVATEGTSGDLTIDRAQLAAALREQTLRGLTGPISFDANGDRKGDTPAEFGLVIYRVFSGKFVRAP